MYTLSVVDTFSKNKNFHTDVNTQKILSDLNFKIFIMQFFKTLSCSLDWTVIAKPLEPQKCLVICSCMSRSGLHLFCQSAMKRSSDDCYLLAVGYTDSEVSLQSI